MSPTASSSSRQPASAIDPAGTRIYRTTVRRRLFALAALVLVPALLCACWGIYSLYSERLERDADNVLGMGRVLASVVERELARREATLHALAVSPALTRGDLAGFAEIARSAAPSAQTTIVLSNTAGRDLLASQRARQAAGSTTSALKPLRDVASPTATLVSDLYAAPDGSGHRFAVQVPIVRQGRVVYFLTLDSGVDVLHRWLEAGKVRAGWSAAILDRNGVVMARSPGSQEATGKPAGEVLWRSASPLANGMNEIVGPGGARAIAAVTPVERSGWTVVLSMPKAELNRSIAGALRYTLGATAVLFVIALLAASYVGRAITRPIDDLVRLATALGRGEKLQPPATGLVETEVVAAQLVQAAERIASANEVLEQRVTQAVEASRRAQAAMLDNQKLEALGRLTGGIAHDFNNLLQTINTSIEIGARFSDDENVKAAMASARRAMQRATRVTRQLMTFARNAVSEPKVLDVRSAVVGLQDLLTGALRRDIDVRVNLAGDLGNIHVDPVQFELAVLNLAINARDAMPGSGMFAISGQNRELPSENSYGLPGGEYVVLSFYDSGSGIPPEALPHLFEPFFTTKGVGKGSGLGLAQVYGFVTQAGGTATVESERGRGTRVDLIVPRTHEEPIGQSDEGLRALPRLAAGATVLFVEDDVLIAEVMEPALRAAGFNVVSASDGVSAREILRERPVDVVLSDIVMPGGMNGIDLARYVQENHPQVPVVLATGFSDAVPRSATVRVLLKPYELHTAMSALLEAISKKAA